MNRNCIKVIIFIGILYIFSFGIYACRGMDFSQRKYNNEYIEITALDTKNELSNNFEVWIESIYCKDSQIDINTIDLSDGWSINNGCIYGQGNGTESPLLVDGNVTRIKFTTHGWSGIAQIKYGEVEKKIDLYSQEASEIEVDINQEAQSNYVILLLIFAMAVLFYTILSYIFLHNKMWRSKFILISYGIHYFINLYVLLCTSDKIGLTAKTRIIFLSITVIACILNYIGWNLNKTLHKYLTKGRIIFVLFIAVYSSLASFSYRFFLTENTRPHLDMNGISYCIAGVIWFVPIIFALLELIEMMCIRINKNSSISPYNKKTRRNTFILLFLLLCLCQFIIWIAFYPGGFNEDVLSALQEGLGKEPLNDWQPILYSLYMGAIYKIFHNIAIITLIQMLLFALLCSFILMMGYDRGISPKKLCLIGILFILLPNQVFSSVAVVKDYPYMLALLWATYLMLRIMEDVDRIRKPLMMISWVIDLFFIFNIRHNGILPVIMILIAFIVITFKKFKFVRGRLLITGGLAILLIGIYRGPIFTALNVTPNSMSSYTTMLCAVGSCINKDLPLSEESEQIMESVIPLSDWAEYYSRFEGHDRYIWGRESDEVYNASQITLKEAAKVYIEAFVKYPDVIIKDRLDGMNIMWDVTQSYDSFNLKSHDSIYPFEYVPEYVDVDKLEQDEKGIYYNNSGLARFYRRALVGNSNELKNILLWRTGAYLILLWVCILYWKTNRAYNIFMAASPLAGHILSCILALYHQSFRYVYCIQVLVLVLLFATIIYSKREFANLYVPK